MSKSQEWLNECPVEIANYLDYTDTFEVTFRVPLEDSAEEYHSRTN